MTVLPIDSSFYKLR